MIPIRLATAFALLVLAQASAQEILPFPKGAVPKDYLLKQEKDALEGMPKGAVLAYVEYKMYRRTHARHTHEIAERTLTGVNRADNAAHMLRAFPILNDTYNMQTVNFYKMFLAKNAEAAKRFDALFVKYGIQRTPQSSHGHPYIPPRTLRGAEGFKKSVARDLAYWEEKAKLLRAGQQDSAAAEQMVLEKKDELNFYEFHATRFRRSGLKQQ